MAAPFSTLTLGMQLYYLVRRHKETSIFLQNFKYYLTYSGRERVSVFRVLCYALTVEK